MNRRQALWSPGILGATGLLGRSHAATPDSSDLEVIPIHIETSTEDPCRAANERLSRELRGRGIPSTIDVLPGPHNQPWLREVGTLEMLRWHAAELDALPAAPVSPRNPERRG